MKILQFCCLLLISICATGMTQAADNSLQIVNIQDIDGDTLQTALMNDMSGFAVEISEGEQLPLYGSMSGDFLCLEDNGQPLATITVQRTLYLRNCDGALQFSIDAVDWHAYDGLSTGNFSLSIGIDSDGVPHLRMDGQLFER